MKNGKREWRPELKERYDRLVTTLPNNGDKTSQTETGLGGDDTRLLGVNISNGGAEEARTPDPLLAKQVLSQLSYSPAAKHRLHHHHYMAISAATCPW